MASWHSVVLNWTGFGSFIGYTKLDQPVDVLSYQFNHQIVLFYSFKNIKFVEYHTFFVKPFKLRGPFHPQNRPFELNWMDWYF